MRGNEAIDERAMASPMHHHARLSFVIVLSFVMILHGEGRRYRLCQDGCCIHEYCAYDLICYPRIHCHFGCPDGYCTGTGNTNQNQIKHTRKFLTSFTANGNSLKSNSPFSNQITEKYSHSDKPSGENAYEREDAKEKDVVMRYDESPKNTQKADGICMPLPPCKKSDPCGMSHSCSYNFNLGYSVCQYNLDIGTTLCYDTHGNFVAKPPSDVK